MHDHFVSGKQNGSGDGRAATTRGHLSLNEMLKHDCTVVKSDGSIWNMGRRYEIDATGVLVEVGALV